MVATNGRTVTVFGGTGRRSRDTESAVLTRYSKRVLQDSITHWNCCGTPSAAVWYDRLLPYAPYATALIAMGALVTAIVAILMQTRVARRRAAIDFSLRNIALLTLQRGIRQHRILGCDPTAGDILLFHPARNRFLHSDTANDPRISPFN